MKRLTAGSAFCPIRASGRATPTSSSIAAAPTSVDRRSRSTRRTSTRSWPRVASRPVARFRSTSTSSRRARAGTCRTQLDQQIVVLNRDYAGKDYNGNTVSGAANTGYTFFKAGSDRTNSRKWWRMTPGSNAEAQAKNALAINPGGALNIYLCSPGQNLLGWAVFPWTSQAGTNQDGVVIHYASLPGGTLSPYNLGGTASHEVGHYLGLYHTFQGGCDTGSCSSTGDLVCDTPAQSTATSGCPSGKDTCPATGLDPIHNYMDYSTDICYTNFSSGQDTRMNAAVNTYRSWIGSVRVANGATTTQNAREAAVASFRAVPNPFNPRTKIEFGLRARLAGVGAGLRHPGAHGRDARESRAPGREPLGGLRRREARQRRLHDGAPRERCGSRREEDLAPQVSERRRYAARDTGSVREGRDEGAASRPGISRDGVRLRLGSRKQRAVFALLALHVNTPVALDRLVDELWHDEPPAQATLSLQSYISRLRRTISESSQRISQRTGRGASSAPRILTRPPGWALMMPAEHVDAVPFVALAREGSSLLEEADAAPGAAKLCEAIALWRGGRFRRCARSAVGVADRVRR